MKRKDLLPSTAETPNPVLQVSKDKDYMKLEFNDIWISCSICQQHINQHLLLHHKQQHKARTVLGYTLWQLPPDIKSLTFPKEQVISQILGSSDYKYRETQKIIHSYEMLKGKMLSSLHYSRRMGSQVYKIDTNNDLISATAVCCNKNAAWKSDMEDSFTVVDNFGKRTNTCFVGLFDGFHGKSAARTVSEEFPVLFLDQLMKMDSSYRMTEEEIHFITSFDAVFKPNYKVIENLFSSTVCEKKLTKISGFEWLHTSYAEAFWRMDRILRLGRKEHSKARWSACTAVTCLIDAIFKANTSQENNDLLETNDQPTLAPKNRLGILHIANIGNIQAVLCRNGKSYCLTTKHSTANPCERKRVIEAGGSISTNEDWGLVEGISRVTRGLGFHGDPKLKKGVIPAPHTISIPIYHSCQFLVLASSGLWEVLSDKEVVGIAKEVLISFLKHSQDLKSEDTNTENPQIGFLDIYTHEADLSKCDHYDQSLPEAAEQHDAFTKPLVLKNDSGHKTGIESSGYGRNTLKEIYENAAAYVCQQLVKTAMLAGSQQNITVCLILLPGCKNLHEHKSSSVR
ncbi:protein phosphatase 2C-like domain-containing protein 1 [Ascaphus truei]|uniref:protein phosphatase 2C-like domain-containing protein 1 n=1 Tax=Ascaphus truei TaxID=8439 RepID=UPI003F593595